jgi:hypothetical protein
MTLYFENLNSIASIVFIRKIKMLGISGMSYLAADQSCVSINSTFCRFMNFRKRENREMEMRCTTRFTWVAFSSVICESR